MASLTDELVAQLTLAEKVALMSGSDIWNTAPVERLGIPAIKVTDGPNGARGDSTTGARSVCLPASIAIAASFDTDLVTNVGRLLGRETARKGAQVLLAPTVNIARHPLGGRNFESFGEDPALTSAVAEAYITGVQDEGVGACAKHFVANDVEYERLTVSSEVDDRTLREVYLAPFCAAVDTGVWTIMSAYPKLNGVHCTENRWLLTELLRDEWGFDGLVMSDWGATHHPWRPVWAGQDLEMPGPPLALGAKLLAAVEDGEIDESGLDESVRRVIDLAVRSGRLGETEPIAEQSVDIPEERALAATAAAGGMVLLRNDGVLPLATGLRSVAVIGPNAHPGVIQGGGSASLQPHRSVSPVQGLEAALPGAAIEHHVGCLAHRYLPTVDRDRWIADGDGQPIVHEIFADLDLTGPPAISRRSTAIRSLVFGGVPQLEDPTTFSMRWRGQLRIDESGAHQFSVMAVGPSRVLVNGELVVDNWTDTEPGEYFFNRSTTERIGVAELEAGTTADVVVEWSRQEFDLLAGLRFGHQAPIDDDAVMEAAVAAASAADAAVVVVGLDAEWETEGSDRVLYGLPRRQDELVRRVAAANPSTVVVVNAGGPIDLPWIDEVPATLMAWYPGQEFGTALADVLLGATDPGGRLPVTFPVRVEDGPTALDVPGDGQRLHYREGLFVGYRWYDGRDIEPRLPFGHGLSYASFEIGQGAVELVGDDVSVRVPVTNTSERSGKCVVQIYVEPPDGDHVRPRRHLGGFGAATIDAGGSTELTIVVPRRRFEIWAEGRWELPSGTYRLRLATSSRSFLHELDIEL